MILASPVFSGAVTVLIVNDWVLKDAVGGWSTGKLSDVAGPAVSLDDHVGVTGLRVAGGPARHGRVHT